MDHKTSEASLEQQRLRFREQLGPAPEAAWQKFPGRIGVVLSGGGARGAYEAGVLLAFQDAQLPTHILAATSIGSINAGCYAAHGTGYVGNAEPMLKAWEQVTPAAVGIDWSRYAMVLAGLIAASAGLGNLLRAWLEEIGIYFHLSDPKLTWFLLFLVGVAIVFFYDQISYAFYVAAKVLRGYPWKPDRRKLAFSLIANATVLGFAWMLFNFAHLHFSPTQEFRPDAPTLALLGAGVLLMIVLWAVLRERISRLTHGAIRLPLRSGLFPNFERTRFLRAVIPSDRLRASPIRVVMTAADIHSGREKFFANCPVSELRQDPGADAEFVEHKMETADDPLKAIVASSAFPMAYELVDIKGARWTDGAIVANEPIRPAIRLGADVLFLVMVDPEHPDGDAVKTFLDVGMRTIEILMQRNVYTDMRLLENVNSLCEKHAAELGVRPEQMRVEIGGRTLRYIKAFVIRPAAALAPALLQFDGTVTAPLVARGYADGGKAVMEFREYLATSPGGQAQRVMRLKVEPLAKGAGTGD